MKKINNRIVTTKSNKNDSQLLLTIPIVAAGFVLRTHVEKLQSDFYMEKSLFSTFSVTSSELYSDALGVSERVRNTGSGFLLKYKNNVYAITNSHVVNKALNVYVHTKNQELLQTKIIYENELVDLAILDFGKVKAPDTLSTLSTLSICIKDTHLGEHVFAIGDPYRLEGSVSSGIISSVSRNDGKFIQTDVEVNPGSSGGPLISEDRQCVVGIVTAKTEGSGISFAVPSSIIINEIESNQN